MASLHIFGRGFNEFFQGLVLDVGCAPLGDDIPRQVAAEFHLDGSIAFCSTESNTIGCCCCLFIHFRLHREDCVESSDDESQ